MSLISVNNLSKKFASENKKCKENSTTALSNINIEINENEFIGIMGRSGCGKTTLLRILGGLDKQTSGEMFFKGNKLSDLTEKKRSEIRRREIGFIFQDFFLLDSLTIKENIIVPMILDKNTVESIKERVNEMSKKFNIGHILDKYPYEVSGGEKQRTAICRALSNDPYLIFADEPTGNLDSISAKAVMETFELIHKTLNKTIVIVTHDPFVASHCDHVLFMKDGEIISDKFNENKNKNNEDFLGKILEQIRFI